MPSLHSPKLEVLIVDDEVQARELLSEFSRAQGYEVAMADDSRAASRSDPFSAQYKVVMTRTISTTAEASSARVHSAMRGSSARWT